MRLSVRLLAAAAAAAAPVLAAVVPVATATPAAATDRTVNAVRLNGYEAGLVARINDARRAAGLRALVLVPGATDAASLEQPDQRFGVRRAGQVSASLVRYTGPSASNDAVYTWLARHGRTGHADLVMRDALDLSRARTLQLQLAAPNPTGRAVFV